MTTFEVGDRVRATADFKGFKINGLEGVVRQGQNMHGVYGIEFDEEFNGGHSLNKLITSGRGLFVGEDFLVRIPVDTAETTIVEIQEEVVTNKTSAQFKNIDKASAILEAARER